MDWRGKAVAFYERACAEGLEAHPQVRAFVADVVNAGAGSAIGSVPLGTVRWGIACSGGADSLALLLWLYGAAQAGVLGRACGGSADGQETGGLKRFSVLHLNHNLRGAHSAGDAAFVGEVAVGLGLPLFTETLAEWQMGQSAPNEENLRRARQAFFARSGCAVVFQGHHCGDVAETMLMRLAAGSGLEGLSAPRPVSRVAGQPVYLRPLLLWKKAEIVALLSGVGIHWREDASNARGDYFRNRVRLDVLPALEQAAQGRDVLAAAGASRARLQEDAEALEMWLDAVWRQAYIDCDSGDSGGSGGDCGSGDSGDGEGGNGGNGAGEGSGGGAPCKVRPAALDWRLFAPLPRALRRRALWRLLGRHEGAAALRGAAVDAMLDALEAAQGSLNLSAGKDWFLRYEHSTGVLAVTNAAECVRSAGGQGAQTALLLAPGQAVRLGDGATLSAQWVELDDDLRSRILAGKIACGREAYLSLPQGAAADDFDAAGGLLRVRFWQAGDRYRPLGAPGSRKVQDVFTDKKVPAVLRGKLPVVTDAQSGAVLWVATLPPADGCAIGVATKWALWLTYTPACKTLVDPIII